MFLAESFVAVLFSDSKHGHFSMEIIQGTSHRYYFGYFMKISRVVVLVTVVLFRSCGGLNDPLGNLYFEAPMLEVLRLVPSKFEMTSLPQTFNPPFASTLYYSILICIYNILLKLSFMMFSGFNN